MAIEKITLELDGLTGEYRLIIAGDHDTLWALREELAGRMLAQHSWRRKRALVPEEARTNPELVAVIVARLCKSEGRPPDSRRVRRELRRMGMETVSYSTSTYLKRAEKAGLVRRSTGGWIPAEGLAARFASESEGLQSRGEAAGAGSAEPSAEPEDGT